MLGLNSLFSLSTKPFEAIDLMIDLLYMKTQPKLFSNSLHKNKIINKFRQCIPPTNIYIHLVHIHLYVIHITQFYVNTKCKNMILTLISMNVQEQSLF